MTKDRWVGQEGTPPGPEFESSNDAGRSRLASPSGRFEWWKSTRTERPAHSQSEPLICASQEGGRRGRRDSVKLRGKGHDWAGECAAGADCAEEFDTVNELDAANEAGSVMCLEPSGRLWPCTIPYDKKVIGVVSGASQRQSGIILGQQKSSTSRVPIALVGTVYCKVDARMIPVEARFAHYLRFHRPRHEG